MTDLNRLVAQLVEGRLHYPTTHGVTLFALGVAVTFPEGFRHAVAFPGWPRTVDQAAEWAEIAASRLGAWYSAVLGS